MWVCGERVRVRVFIGGDIGRMLCLGISEMEGRKMKGEGVGKFGGEGKGLFLDIDSCN